MRGGAAAPSTPRLGTAVPKPLLSGAQKISCKGMAALTAFIMMIRVKEFHTNLAQYSYTR